MICKFVRSKKHSMSISVTKQIARKIEKSLNDWDIEKAILNSRNETQTRDYLIEFLKYSDTTNMILITNTVFKLILVKFRKLIWQ